MFLKKRWSLLLLKHQRQTAKFKFVGLNIFAALTSVRAVSFLSKPTLILMGISTTKMFLIFINILRAEEEMRCFISLSHSTKPPYILKVTTDLIKIYIFSLLGWYITFSLTLLSLITCEFYGGSVLIFGTVKTYSFAGLPLP